MKLRHSQSILKSNMVLTMLLFFLGAARAELADTLILDGEVVNLEPAIRYVDLDSLEKAGKNDIRYPSQPFHFYLGVSQGLILSASSWSSADTAKSVDVYTNKRSAWKMSMGTHMQMLIPVNDEFFLEAGAGYSVLKFQTNSVDPSDTISNASRFRYENINGDLYEYYRYAVGKGFETDTIAVPLIARTSRIQFAEAFLGFRYFPLKMASAFKPYVGADVLFRYKLNELSDQSIALINDNGIRRDITFKGSGVQKSLIMSRIKLGTTWQLNSRWMAEANCAFFYFPKVEFGNSNFYSVGLRQFSLHFGLMRYF